MDNLTFVSLDTETTGLDPFNDRIIQYGMSVFVRGVCVHTETFDVKQEVPNNGFHINGISDERIAAGNDPLYMLGILGRLFAKKPRRFLVYNSPFDLSFIGAEFARYKMEWDFRPLTIIDPLVIWRRFHPFKKGTLSYAASYYGIPYNDEHDAGPDSAAAGHVYCQMYSQHGQLHNTYSNKMFEGWYNRWAGSFTEYLRIKGLPYELATFQWPVRGEFVCSDPSVLQDQMPLW